MSQSIVTQAFALWVETLPLDAEGCDITGQAFHDLYSKECELFSLMRQFTPEDSALYAQLICEWNVDPKNN